MKDVDEDLNDDDDDDNDDDGEDNDVEGNDGVLTLMKRMMNYKNRNNDDDHSDKYN